MGAPIGSEQGIKLHNSGAFPSHHLAKTYLSASVRSSSRIVSPSRPATGHRGMVSVVAVSALFDATPVVVSGDDGTAA